MTAFALPSLRRYAAFFSVSFINHLENRMKVILRFVSCMVFIIVFIEMWRLIAREGLFTLPVPLNNVLWYVALTQMMLFLSPRLFMVIDDDVRSGDIACFLIRPMPYLWMRFAEGVGAMTGNVVTYYTIGIAIIYAYIGALPESGIIGVAAALILLWFASVLHLLFQITAGITALWLQDAEALYRVYSKLMIVLGGLYMPLSFYPAWAQNIARFTPFPVMMYDPVRPVLDGASFGILASSIALIALWIVIAAALMQGVYALCVRRLEINGG